MKCFQENKTKATPQLIYETNIFCGNVFLPSSSNFFNNSISKHVCFQIKFLNCTFYLFNAHLVQNLLE